MENQQNMIVVADPPPEQALNHAHHYVGMQTAESVLEGHDSNLPPLDEHAMRQIQPYLVLGETIGECTHALANRPATSIRISYFGRLAAMDTALITRAIQKGYLQHISGRKVNWINAPVKLADLGISSESIQSSDETDFAGLLRLEPAETSTMQTSC